MEVQKVTIKRTLLKIEFMINDAKKLAAVKVYEKAKNFKTEPSGKKINTDSKKRGPHIMKTLFLKV